MLLNQHSDTKGLLFSIHLHFYLRKLYYKCYNLFYSLLSLTDPPRLEYRHFVKGRILSSPKKTALGMAGRSQTGQHANNNNKKILLHPLRFILLHPRNKETCAAGKDWA